MKRKCKVSGMISWILAFALFISGVNMFELKVAEAASTIYTSKDGLWKYEFVVEGSGETVVSVDGYLGSDSNLVIPGEIDGYEVRYIGKQGSGDFNSDVDRFVSITLPDSVTGCYNIPFFSPCHNLDYLYLGKNYGTYSQYGRDINLIKAEAAYDIQTKEYRVSPENTVITAVDGVLYSKDMTKLRIYPALKRDITFTVPKGVISIEDDAMQNIQYLENLILPDGFEEMGVYCCAKSSIRSVSLPKSLTNLNSGVFYQSKLESIVLPEGLTSIGGCTFTGTPLEKIVIPDSVVSLGVEVFMDCDKLKSIEIGSGLASIGGNCFYGLTSLETFKISEGNLNFKSENGMLLTKDGSTLIQYATTGNTKFILPDGVTIIGDNACYGLPFDEIIIPDRVVSIGDGAFKLCAKAEKVYVPSSVKSLGDSAFAGCTSLKTATVDAPVKSVNSAFSGCKSLTEIRLPDTIKSVWDSDFFGGDTLRSIYLKSSKAPSISYIIYIQGQDAMTEMIKKSNNVRIFVPEDAQGYDVMPWSRMHIIYGDTVTAERLTLNPSAVFMDEGETGSVSTVVSPEDAVLQDIVWESSNEGVASVDKNGRIKALSAGTATIKATAGEVSATCIVTVRGNQEAQNFRVETSKGTVSSNYNAQNYISASNPMKSYLFEDEEGYLTRAEFIDGKLIYETYDEGGTMKDSGSIKDELPLTGGFYVSDKYRFVVYGQSNSSKSDNTEVMRIVKYDQKWTRISSCSLYGENTSVPFDGGSLRFAESGETLYIRTCHTMYNGHQANMQVAVDMSDMEVTDVLSKTANIDYGGYVSHSFNQFLRMDGEDLIALDHGDTYPRSSVLIKYPNIKDTTYSKSSVEYIETLRFWGITGAYLTGASIGGLEVSENHYISVGNYENYNKDASTVRNIFVNITDKDYLRDPNTKTIYLTDYKKGSDVMVSTPQLVKVSEKTFLVLWNEMDKSGIKVHSQMIDEIGNKITEEQSFHGSLSDCQPILQKGEVVWYYTGTEKGDTTPIICRLAVDGKETNDNLLDREADQEGKPEKEDDKDIGEGDGKENDKDIGESDGKEDDKNAKENVTDNKGVVKKNTVSTVKKGTSHKIGSYGYKVTGASTVSMTGVKDKKITKVKVPKTVKIDGKTLKVTAISDNAFSKTKITHVTIGSNVSRIGAAAFKNCKKMKNITIRSTRLKSVGKNAFKGIRSKAKIKVPARKLKAYKKILKGKGQGKQVKIVKVVK